MMHRDLAYEFGLRVLSGWYITGQITDDVESAWQVTDPTGGRWMLKAKRTYLSDSEFDAHLHVHRIAFKRGAPVPKPFESVADRLVARDGQRFELIGWVDGAPARPADRVALARGASSLASFHAAATGALDGIVVHQQEPRDRFAKARHHLEGLAVGAIAPAQAERLASILEDAELQKRSTEAPSRILHGDPCGSNMLVGPSGTVILIDFDDIHQGPVASDLAWLLVEAATSSCIGGPGFRAGWDHAMCRAVLSGYAAAAGAEHEGLIGLRAWTIAALVCAATDRLYHGDWRVPLSSLPGVFDRVIVLADELPTLPGAT